MRADGRRAANTARYGRMAIMLHWVVAALIALNVCVGLAAANAPAGRERPLVDLHKSIGLTLLGLVVLRILWRLAHPPPPLPASYRPLERKGAHAAHALLYVVILLLPLTGYIHDSAWKFAATHPIVLFGVMPFPRIGFIQSLAPTAREQVHAVFAAAHIYLGYVLYGLLALHLAGVAKHHLVDREAELQRMWPSFRRRSDTGA